MMGEPTRRKVINSEPLVAELVKRGIVPSNCRRVVIDMQAQEPAVLYYELYGDERLLEVFASNSGVAIKEATDAK